jgi:hypothetical protein
MLGALLDFISCKTNNCTIGGAEDSPRWPSLSNSYGGTRTKLKIPVTEISTESDTSFDARCAYYDKVLASKYGIVPGQSPPSAKPPIPAAKRRPDIMQNLFYMLANIPGLE